MTTTEDLEVINEYGRTTGVVSGRVSPFTADARNYLWITLDADDPVRKGDAVRIMGTRPHLKIIFAADDHEGGRIAIARSIKAPPVTAAERS